MTGGMGDTNETQDAQRDPTRWRWFSRWPPITKLIPPLILLLLNASRLPRAYPVSRPVLVALDGAFIAWIAVDAFVNFLVKQPTGATAGRFAFPELLAVMLLVGMTIGLLFN